MQTKALIEQNNLSFQLSDEVGKLHAYAIENFQKNLPIFENKKFLGCISMDDLEGISFTDQLKEHAYLIRKFSISEDASDLMLLTKFSQHQTDVLPVLNDEKLIGMVHLNDFLSSFSDLPFLNFRGEEIRLRKKRIDFTYSELSQIVESQNAKILGVYTSSVDNEYIELSLRLDHNGMNEILQTLRRYDYEVLSYHEDDQHSESLKENSAYFDKFLNI